VTEIFHVREIEIENWIAIWTVEIVLTGVKIGTTDDLIAMTIAQRTSGNETALQVVQIAGQPVARPLPRILLQHLAMALDLDQP
jgi:hypothetical protein